MDEANKNKAAEVNVGEANLEIKANSTAPNRSPISSAPQNVIEVGNADLKDRKRGWWSRSE